MVALSFQLKTTVLSFLCNDFFFIHFSLSIDYFILWIIVVQFKSGTNLWCTFLFHFRPDRKRLSQLFNSKCAGHVKRNLVWLIRVNPCFHSGQRFNDAAAVLYLGFHCTIGWRQLRSHPQPIKTAPLTRLVIQLKINNIVFAQLSINKNQTSNTKFPKRHGANLSSLLAQTSFLSHWMNE